MINDSSTEAFAKAETSFNSIRQLVNSWIPADASGLSKTDPPIKKTISLYEATKSKSIKISRAEKIQQELEQSVIALEEEEREMKSGSVKKRKQNDVLNLYLNRKKKKIQN